MIIWMFADVLRDCCGVDIKLTAKCLTQVKQFGERLLSLRLMKNCLTFHTRLNLQVISFRGNFMKAFRSQHARAALVSVGAQTSKLGFSSQHNPEINESSFFQPDGFRNSICQDFFFLFAFHSIEITNNSVFSFELGLNLPKLRFYFYSNPIIILTFMLSMHNKIIVSNIAVWRSHLTINIVFVFLSLVLCNKT